MKSTPSRWSIGDLAGRFGLASHVLRHWEDEGLLCPERDSAGRRVYRESDVYRVAVIVSSKAAGMTLEQIRGLLDASTAGRHAMLTAHLADIDARIAELERSRHLAEHALQCRAHDIGNCPNFQAHLADLVAGTLPAFPDPKAFNHLPGHHTGAAGPDSVIPV
jgi:DNA-binding transcriptional MerR regulator